MDSISRKIYLRRWDKEFNWSRKFPEDDKDQKTNEETMARNGQIVVMIIREMRLNSEEISLSYRSG